ncbi:hypothetical protein JT05_11105 [Desulfosporosinus sp. Tol-M]|jgi:hypothetical protein|nr:hypothetical protein JT05_11105 [Desulfosporosinus sp. Tol-M]
MFNTIMLRKTRKSIVFMILSLVLVLSVVLSQAALAVNAPGDKGINFSGYAFVSGNQNYNLKVFLDKNCASCLDAGYFKVHDMTDNDDKTVTLYGTSSDKPTSASWYPTGTCALLKISGLEANHEYRVTVSNSVYANNGFTLGQMAKNKDCVFYFEAPDSNGAYTLTPRVTVYPSDGTSNLAWEGNALFTTNRPMQIDPDNLGYFKKYYNSAWQDNLDQTFDANAVTNAYGYLRQVMDIPNTWYYPETTSGTSGGVSYNLNNANDNGAAVNFRLQLPYLKPVVGGSYTNYNPAAGYYAFSTNAYDIPAKLAKPTVATGANSGEITVTVTKGTSSNYPIATEYNFYVCSDKYFFDGTATLTNGTPYSNSSSSFNYTITGLTPGANYYVVVAPVISSGFGEGGYSPASVQVQAHS